MLSAYKRIVIKVGSALLVDQRAGRLKSEWLASLVADISRLKDAGVEVAVVSSGAIALGRTILKLPSGVLSLEQSQASAAVGQIALARAWSEALAVHKHVAAQVLVTPGDTEARRRYLNAQATMFTLLGMGAVPVINENDTVATAEIRYGDNDRLAARVASMIEADCVVLLSDVDGLYTANPAQDKAARHIAVVEKITPQIEGMAGGAASEFSRGGMKTKVEAAKIATGAGAALIIANGHVRLPLYAMTAAGNAAGGRYTLFKPALTPLAARKRWIAGAMAPAGALSVDDGALLALISGKSLLPAGVVAVSGAFSHGDVVSVLNAAGQEIARGLVGYDAADARRVAGLKSADIAAVLGGPARTEMIHRNDLVMTHDA